MGQFRKKPVVIEAREFHGTQESAKAICNWGAAYGCEMLRAFCGHDEPYEVYINTLEGRMTAKSGDWVIRGVNNEFYPCKPDIFEQTYEPADRRAPEPAEHGELWRLLVRHRREISHSVWNVGTDEDLITELRRLSLREGE